MASCSDSEPLIDQAAQILTELSKQNWKIKSVERDNVDYTSFYTDFKIEFGGLKDNMTYKTFNRPSKSPWMSSGTAKFGTNISTQLILNTNTSNELLIEYVISSNQLIVKFSFNGEGYNNRVSQVKGNWTFTFIR